MRTAVLVALLTLLCLALCACQNPNRWSNPASGIPTHPGSAPPVGYVRSTPPAEDADLQGDAHSEAAVAPADADADRARQPETSNDAAASEAAAAEPSSDVPPLVDAAPANENPY